MFFLKLLKKIPGLAPLKRSFFARRGWGNADFGTSRIRILKTFAPYAPNSSGNYNELAGLTIATIQNLFPSIVGLARTTSEDLEVLSAEDPEEFAANQGFSDASLALAGKFNHYFSDKSKCHNYHLIYAPILGNPEKVRLILEIGLGTNHDDVVSSMGHSGMPGASVRAFRDYCPNAAIFGADIDSRILFQEDRIATYHVDQLSADSLDKLRNILPKGFDLVIDDGLHSPDANINTFAMATKLVRKGGWIVIEDIAEEAIPIWQGIAPIIRMGGYKPRLFRAKGGIVFAAQKE